MLGKYFGRYVCLDWVVPTVRVALKNEDVSRLHLVLIAKTINSGYPYSLYLDMAYPMMYLCSADRN